MRFSMLLWTASLASQVAGLPSNGHIVRRVSSSASPTASSTTVSSTPSASSSSLSDDLTAAICKQGGMTTENWEKAGMDNFIKEFLEENLRDQSVPATFASKLTDWSGYNCGHNGCSLGQYSEDTCRKGNNPRLLFVLTAYSNFYNFVSVDMKDKTEKLYDITQGTLGKMSDTFAPADLGDETNEKTDTLITMSAVFGIVAGATGVLPEVGAPLGAIFGVGAGAAGIGVGIQNFLADSTAAARAIVQKDNVKDNIQANAAWFINDLKDSFANYSYGMTEGVPTSSNLTTYLDTFANGSFAEIVSTSLSDEYYDQTLVTMYAAALGYLLRSKQAFVAVGTKDINGKAPCDIDITQTTNEQEFYRVCDTDTGKAWFLATQPTSSQKWDTPFPAVYGVGSLRGTYGIDLGTVMVAALWQQKIAGFDSSFWTLERTKDVFSTSETPPKNYLPVLPVCEFDNISDPKYISGSTGDSGQETIWVRQKFAECGSLKIGSTSWPYGKFPGM